MGNEYEDGREAYRNMSKAERRVVAAALRGGRLDGLPTPRPSGRWLLGFDAEAGLNMLSWAGGVAFVLMCTYSWVWLVVRDSVYRWTP